MLKKIQVYYYTFFVIALFCFATIAHSSEKNTLISLGDKNAKVTVKVFSSLTCPHCAHFHTNVFKNLKSENFGKVSSYTCGMCSENKNYFICVIIAMIFFLVACTIINVDSNRE